MPRISRSIQKGPHMIGYVTIGVSNMDAAKTFYTSLFEDKGAQVLIDAGRIAFIGNNPAAPMLPSASLMMAMTARQGMAIWCLSPPTPKRLLPQCMTRRSALARRTKANPGSAYRTGSMVLMCGIQMGNKLCFYVFG